MIADVDALAARFHIAPGVISHACAHPGVTGEGDRTLALAAVVAQHRAARLGTVATRVERLSDWSDLVVADDHLDALRELVARVRQRRTVLEVWGMERIAATCDGMRSTGPGTLPATTRPSTRS